MSSSATIIAPVIPAAPVPRTTLSNNFAWTSAGNAVYSACQWGIVSVLAKLGSAELVGQYALGVAVATPIMALAQLNLRSVLVTDVAQQHDFRDYRDLRIVSLIVAMLIVVALAFTGHRGGDRLIVMMTGLVLAIEWMSDIYLGLLQQHERMNRIAISLSVRGVLALAALAAVIAFTGSLALGLAAMLAVRLLVLMLFDSARAVSDCMDHSARLPFTQRLRDQARIFQTAFPLGLVLMITALSTNIPRYFIAHQLGNHELGIFSAIASITAAASLLVNALGQAATPKLAKLYVAFDHRGFRKLSLQLALIGVALGAAAMAGSLLVGRFVLAAFFRPEYANHVDLLVLLSLAAGMGFVASLLGYAITAGRRFKEQLPLQIASVASAAGSAFLLVPRYGLTGAAIACAIGPLVQALGELIVLRAALNDIRPQKDMHFSTGAAAQ
jgi:O-antigen/teichoic acid export membrane protein